MNQQQPTFQPALIDDQKSTMASQLVHRLREAILAGELAPGAKINLERVRARFEVSLSPLREALARLIADGLVTFEDNRGYRVAPVSLQNLDEVTQLRMDCETLALRNAIATGDLGWEGDVMRALHRLNRTPRDPSQPASLEAWETAHREFHLCLIDGCRLPLLTDFCRKLLNLNDRYRRNFLRIQPSGRDVRAEHSEIAEASVARDTEFACEKLRAHIDRTGLNLRSYLAESLARGGTEP